MPFAPAAEAARSGDRTSNSAWLLGAGLVLVIGVRAYYLVLARDQPVWWDEAEYLIKARALALGTPDTGFFSGRPLLLSLVMAAIYAVGLGELTIRVGLAMVSTATIYMTYRVSLRIVDQSAAIVTAALFSMFYLQLFYTNRI
jgi:hypothetical protein